MKKPWSKIRTLEESVNNLAKMLNNPDCFLSGDVFKAHIEMARHFANALKIDLMLIKRQYYKLGFIDGNSKNPIRIENLDKNAERAFIELNELENKRAK
jgi:hypothetical protein